MLSPKRRGLGMDFSRFFPSSAKLLLVRSVRGPIGFKANAPACTRLHGRWYRQCSPRAFWSICFFAFFLVQLHLTPPFSRNQGVCYLHYLSVRSGLCQTGPIGVSIGSGMVT
jgi:hypothetical protein